MGKFQLLTLAVFLVILHVCLSYRDSKWDRFRGLSRKAPRWMDWDRSWMPRGHRRNFRHRFDFDFGFDGDSWFSFDSSWDRSWWKGPNVCVTKTEEIDEDTKHLTGASVLYHDALDSFKYTRITMTSNGLVTETDLYECCDGFTRSGKEYGCPTEVPLLSMPELLDELELSQFVSLLNSTGLDSDTLSTKTTKLTLFVPKNEALKSYIPLVSVRSLGEDLKDMPSSVVMVSQDITNSMIDDARNLLLGHMVVGRVTSSKFDNDQLLETASPHGAYVRMNVYSGYPKKVITANCQRVTSVDNIADNGVIHIVENVLKPVTDTLLDLIKKNPELSILKTALGSSQLGSMLKDEDGQFTILAPTDSAFKKYEDLLLKITSNSDCLENILKNHVLPVTLCSAGVQGRIRTKNLLHKRLEMSRDKDDKIYIEKAQIVTPDHMAVNGVLFIIDDVIIPDEALNVLQLAEKRELSEFGKLVDIADMKKQFKTAENVTVFIPSNEAIQALPSKVRSELTKDGEALSDILEYHIVPDRIVCRRELWNGDKLDTLQGSQLTINEYSQYGMFEISTQTVQCANIQKTYYKGCGSNVYIIDKVMIPPAGSVLDVLAQDPRFSTLVELLKMAQLADTLQETGPFTVFAPTNKAFKSLGTDAVDELKDSPSTLKSILLNHISQASICCAALTRKNFFNSQKVRTMSGNVFDIGKKDYRETYYLANADVTECDVMATNGVVHIIDDVITGRSERHSFWGRNGRFG
ncbi:hypothetical protein ACF0H5_005076 [Mactra antiquata]